MHLERHLPDRALRIAKRWRAELAPYPGRLNLTGRCLLSSTLVIVASLTLQVPLLAMSLVFSFYVTQSNIVLTRLVGILFMLGTTIAVIAVELIYKFACDYPLYRVLAAFALLFACMYMMRATKAGIMFYMVGLIVIYAQTFADLPEQTETVVRTALWVWVAANYPIALALLINTLLLPAEPVAQLNAEMRRQLGEVVATLEHAAGERTSAPPLDTEAVEHGILTLRKLLRFATMRDPDYRQHQAGHLARIATVSRLHGQACALLHEPGQAGDARALRALRAACAALSDSLLAGVPFVLAPPEQNPADAVLAPPALEIRRALQALSDRSRSSPQAEPPVPKDSLLNPNAFANPLYTRFALKVVFAASLGYLFYEAADWNGIHTAMMTCLVLAQPSLGASGRRGMLRFAGALLGSGLALFATVFIVPHLDGIVGLLMTCLPVLALAAWVQAGSERISYAGTQLMYTFALALLGQFGPSTDLTEIRDRMVGVALGVALSLVIYSTLWPEGEGQTLRERSAALLRRLAALIRVRSANPRSADIETVRAYESAWADLADCEDVLARVALEPGWQYPEGEQEQLTQHLQVVLARTREILLAGDAFQSAWHAQASHVTASMDDTLTRLRGEALAGGLTQYADDLAVDHWSRAPVTFITSPAALIRPLGEDGPPAEAAGDAALAGLLGRIGTVFDRVASLPVQAWPNTGLVHAGAGERT